MKVLTNTFVDALTVKQARERLTFGQLAEKTGVNSVTISRIINRKVDTAQERTFDKLNDWLLGDMQ
ncbi:helix-turn-helix domain-containing protein [Fructobacillus cardui]|uniref:helix-turn-helix domain-containing protein n=1 Tax=Fructobacillus cardui TaxID=2893170 RepID=UPI00200A6667|nr:helix-turn-helix transcriptional regulator [Fructobacillus cardui]MCK8628149.1 helix-turn-helix transcriptional regulator [Fructobacillus cardui]